MPTGPFDLSKATYPAAADGYDLTKATQAPRGGRSGFDHSGKARQSPGEAGGLPLTKATAQPEASTSVPAARRAKKRR